jgi:hypothetical protein
MEDLMADSSLPRGGFPSKEPVGCFLHLLAVLADCHPARFVVSCVVIIGFLTDMALDARLTNIATQMKGAKQWPRMEVLIVHDSSLLVPYIHIFCYTYIFLYIYD